MSDVYKATKNKIVVNSATENPDVYKATANKQIDKKMFVSDKIRNVAVEASPFPSGTLTPTKLNNQANNKVANIQIKKQPDFNLNDKTGLFSDKTVTPTDLNNYAKQSFRENQNLLAEAETKAQPYIDSYNQFLVDKKKSNTGSGNNSFLNAINQGFATPDSISGAMVQNYFTARKVADEDFSKYEINDNWSQNERIALAEEFKNSPEAAMKFAEKVNREIDNRIIAAAGGKNFLSGVAASVASVPVKMASGIEQGINMLEYGAANITGYKDYEMRHNYASDLGNSLRAGVTDSVDLQIGNWDAFDFVYNTVMSGADSLASATMGNAGMVLLGLSAAADTSNDILNRGGTSQQAFWGGLAAGAFEAIFERISLGNLKAFKEVIATNGKNIIKNLAKTMLVNATEEGATEIANILYDTFANGNISNWANMIKEYQNKGFSEQEAKHKAATTLGIQVVESAASGALMGLMFGGGGTLVTQRNAVSAGKVIAANETEGAVINQGLLMDKNTDSYKMAEMINKSGDMTPAEIGSLAAQILEDVNTQKGNIVKNAIETRANGVDITSKALESVAEYFAKSASGGEITKREIVKVNKIDFTKTITAEIKSGEAWVKDMQKQLSAYEQTENTIMEAVTFGKQGNSLLQSQDNGGIINQGGEEDVNQRANEPSVEEIRRKHFKAKDLQQSQRSKSETAEAFAERARRIGAQSSGKKRILLNLGKSSIAYTPSNSDGVLNEFVKKLNAIGIEAYCSEEIVETNSNGITTIHEEAMTTSKGKIFFCESSELANKEKADHELVHYALRILDDSYLDFEETVIKNLNFESNYYIAFCLELNQREYNNQYSVTENGVSVEDAAVFNSEAAAYVYQTVLNNTSFANEFFSNTFKDWEIVKKAVNIFNSKMPIDTNELTEADFTESANFMPKNENNTIESGEYGLAEPTDQEIYREHAEEENSVKTVNIKDLLYEKKSPRRKHSTAAEQNLIKRVANSLGVKVEFVHITAELLRSHGHDFNDGDILPDGFYSEKTDTAYISEKTDTAYIGYTAYSIISLLSIKIQKMNINLILRERWIRIYISQCRARPPNCLIGMRV